MRTVPNVTASSVHLLLWIAKYLWKDCTGLRYRCWRCLRDSKGERRKGAFSTSDLPASAMFLDILLYLEYTGATQSPVAQKWHMVILFYILTG
jgi:hypothetical protein